MPHGPGGPQVPLRQEEVMLTSLLLVPAGLTSQGHPWVEAHILLL